PRPRGVPRVPRAPAALFEELALHDRPRTHLPLPQLRVLDRGPTRGSPTTGAPPPVPHRGGDAPTLRGGEGFPARQRDGPRARVRRSPGRGALSPPARGHRVRTQRAARSLGQR